LSNCFSESDKSELRSDEERFEFFEEFEFFVRFASAMRVENNIAVDDDVEMI
jgi:hypothetical protein